MAENIFQKRKRELDEAAGIETAPQPSVSTAQNEPEEAPEPKKVSSPKPTAKIPAKPSKTGLWEALAYATGMKK